MKIKKIIFASILSFCLSISLYAQNIGDRVYKELLIGGKTVYKWCKISSIEQFSETGKITLEKGPVYNVMYFYDDNDRLISDSNGNAYKYDSFGNMIWAKYTGSNSEIYYEYNDKGKIIHSISSKNFEEWYEYDNNNNLIHQIEDSSNPSEKGKNIYNYYDEYDSNNNLIHSYEVDKNNIVTYDKSISYNNQNQKTYEKIQFLNNGKAYMINEYFYQYDSSGNLSFKKNIYTDKDSKTSISDSSYKYFEQGLSNYIYETYQGASGTSSISITETEFWNNDKKIPKSKIVYKLQ